MITTRESFPYTMGPYLKKKISLAFKKKKKPNHAIVASNHALKPPDIKLI